MPDSPELLPPQLVAARLGTTAGTLAKRRIRGTGPAFRKIGRRVLYPVSEVVAFIVAAPSTPRRGRALTSPRAA